MDIVGGNAVGLHKILSLLESEDVDVRVHAVKVVANLAAEGVVPALMWLMYPMHHHDRDYPREYRTKSFSSQLRAWPSLHDLCGVLRR